MSVQACEGVWRQKCGRYVAVIPCDRREGGQRWTDGIIHYFNDGTVTFAEGGSVVDLVEYIGPLPDGSQRAPVSRPAETESTTAGVGGVSDDPGRIIYELEQGLKTANATIIGANATIIEQSAEINRLRTELQQTQAWRAAATDAHSQSETLRIEQATEIERLKAEWQTEFTAAQQLRSEVAQLERLLDDARDNLRVLEADGTAMDHHCEGMKAAFLAVIKTLTGGRP